jgi:hypothetical protein
MISIISFDYVRHVTIIIEGKLGLYYGKIDELPVSIIKIYLKKRRDINYSGGDCNLPKKLKAMFFFSFKD